MAPKPTAADVLAAISARAWRATIYCRNSESTLHFGGLKKKIASARSGAPLLPSAAARRGTRGASPNFFCGKSRVTH